MSGEIVLDEAWSTIQSTSAHTSLIADAFDAV